MDREGSGGALVALLIAGVVLYQCSKSHSESTAAEVEDRVADRAADIQAGSYQDTYGDEGCTTDCSGHEKGFEWARDNNIASEADCSSHGDDDGSFAQGCQAYVQAEDRAREEVENEKNGGE